MMRMRMRTRTMMMGGLTWVSDQASRRLATTEYLILRVAISNAVIEMGS